MANRNLKYRNGLLKRDLVRATWTQLVTAGALQPHAPRQATSFALDTNLMFVVTEYWGEELRSALRALARAQPSLRLYVLDVVASEMRGTRERQELYDAIVWNGHNADVAVIYPLRADRGTVPALASALEAAWPTSKLLKPSDRKDILIAAAASANGMTVLTANGADFARLALVLPGLRYLAIEGSELERGSHLLAAAAQPFLVAN